MEAVLIDLLLDAETVTLHTGNFVVAWGTLLFFRQVH